MADRIEELRRQVFGLSHPRPLVSETQKKQVDNKLEHLKAQLSSPLELATLMVLIEEHPLEAFDPVYRVTHRMPAGCDVYLSHKHVTSDALLRIFEVECQKAGNPAIFYVIAHCATHRARTVGQHGRNLNTHYFLDEINLDCLAPRRPSRGHWGGGGSGTADSQAGQHVGQQFADSQAGPLSEMQLDRIVDEYLQLDRDPGQICSFDWITGCRCGFKDRMAERFGPLQPGWTEA